MKKAGLILTLTLLAGSTFSQEKKSTMDNAPLGERQDAVKDEADAKITNRRFRAQNGSLSDFSVNLNVNYSAGSVNKPFAADRPNITGAADTVLSADASVGITGTYRLTKLDRINAGIGMYMLAPFHTTLDTENKTQEEEFEDNQGNLQVNDPFISYTHLNKFFGVQTIFNVGYTRFTNEAFTENRQMRDRVDASINTMYDTGNGFSFGLLVTGYRTFFDSFTNDGKDIRSAQLESSFGFLPQAEYVINDTFNLRTIVRTHWYDNVRSQSSDEWRTRPITQSVGLGISVSRDIFLYPNIQFAYDNLQADNTNIGLSANINMF